MLEGTFQLSPTESIIVGLLAAIAAIVYIVLFYFSVKNCIELSQRQNSGTKNTRLKFTQFIIFAIEIFRLGMNGTLVYHAVYKAVLGNADDGQSQADIRMLSMFDMFLVSAQFCSVIFALNQCAHLMKLILQLQGVQIEPEQAV